jgi:acetylglutamate kinase
MPTHRATRGAAVVVRIEGSALETAQALPELSRHLHDLAGDGLRPIVVHGADTEFRRLHEALGIPCAGDTGLRPVSDESMRLCLMVTCGLVNQRLVAGLVTDGHEALGLSGVDLGLLQASFLNRPALGRVGGPPSVRRPLLQHLLDQGWIPVLAAVCLADDGQPISVPADTLAHAVATELGALALEFVSPQPGITVNQHLAPHLTVREVQELIHHARLDDALVPVLQAAVAALTAGVTRVRVGDLPGMRSGTATEMTA